MSTKEEVIREWFEEQRYDKIGVHETSMGGFVEFESDIVEHFIANLASHGYSIKHSIKGIGEER